MRNSVIKFNIKFAFDTVKHFIRIFVDMKIQRSVLRLQNVHHVIVQLPDFQI